MYRLAVFWTLTSSLDRPRNRYGRLLLLWLSGIIGSCEHVSMQSLLSGLACMVSVGIVHGATVGHRLSS